jgi:hypothetical protein
MVIWYIFPLVRCAKKNLATLAKMRRPDFLFKKFTYMSIFVA